MTMRELAKFDPHLPHSISAQVMHQVLGQNFSAESFRTFVVAALCLQGSFEIRRIL
jgi:hypothetical protein